MYIYIIHLLQTTSPFLDHVHTHCPDLPTYPLHHPYYSDRSSPAHCSDRFSGCVCLCVFDGNELHPFLLQTLIPLLLRSKSPTPDCQDGAGWCFSRENHFLRLKPLTLHFSGDVGLLLCVCFGDGWGWQVKLFSLEMNLQYSGSGLSGGKNHFSYKNNIFQ